MYEKIYKDFADWLKFTEAKILAMLTIQIGFLYFIYNVGQVKYHLLIVLLGIITCGLLIYAIFPNLNVKSDNVLYYGAWLNEEVDSKAINIDDKDYHQQCVDLVKIIKKKINSFKIALVIFSIEILIILFPIVLNILSVLE